MRGMPVITSTPMPVRMRPISTETLVLITLPPSRPAKAAYARNMTEKYSGGPQVSAYSAMVRAKKARRLSGWTATPSPNVRSWIACHMGSRSAEVGKLEDAARKADLENALEEVIPGDGNQEAHRDHGWPAVLADEPQVDEEVDDRGGAEADQVRHHQHPRGGGRDLHHRHQAGAIEKEGLADRGARFAHEDDRAAQGEQDPQPEGEDARPGLPLHPVGPHLVSLHADGRGEGDDAQRHQDLSPAHGYFFTSRSPFVIRSLCRTSAFSSHLANSGPVMNWALRALSDTYLFQSADCVTFCIKFT